MESYYKLCAGVLITAVVCLMVSKQEKDITLLIILAGCCMVASAAITYLQPVVTLINRLSALADLDSGFIGIIFKAVGIGLLSEITCLICTDSGNQALAKTLQILTSAVILWISLPLFTQLLDLIEQVLGNI